MSVNIKRIYESPSPDDGYRILVDRLWPRGVSKKAAQLDEWMKEIAPSHELRKWFHRRDDNFEEFTRRYREELKEKTDELQHLRNLAEQGTITLLYASKDTENNHAGVLKKILE